MRFHRTYIIAEAGVNHNGSLLRALGLVRAAAIAGADAVKFQTFRASALAGIDAPKARYQQRSTNPSEGQLQMLRRLELSHDDHLQLKALAGELGIDFLSSPFDLESLTFLTDRLKVSRLKIASGEITNAPLLLLAARSGRPVMLSTGMSTLREIEDALGVLAYGYLGSTRKPSVPIFRSAYRSWQGRAALRRKAILLQCTTEYPAPYQEVNLLAMDNLRKHFGLAVGLSDHTQGYAVAIAAAALGAAVIEKHFTLDRSLPGPDQSASLEPLELKAMVTSIRQVEQALGAPGKRVTVSERKNRPIARKSLVALKPIEQGRRFTADNLGIKRPGNGISPMRYWELLGKKADRAYRKDEMIR